MRRFPRALPVFLVVLIVYLAVARGLFLAWRTASTNDYGVLEMWVNLRAVLREGLEQGLLEGLGVGLAVASIALLVRLVASRRGAGLARPEAAEAAHAAGPGRPSRPAVLAAVLLLPVLVAAASWIFVDRLAEARLASHAGADRPNVILVVVDTLRADALGVYGSKAGVSPHIDAFSEGALVYREMTAQSPCTINSSPSILASLYPSEHGFINYKTRISDRLVTLAEALREAGYETFGISSNPHVSVRNGLAQGFDSFTEDRKWAGTDAEEINREFLEWLPERPGRPFFAMLWYIDPHEPYEPPAEFAARNLDARQRAEAARVLELRAERVSLDAGDQQILEALYRAEVDYFDSQFAELVAALEARGILEDAVVVLTSDHGETFGEHVALDGKRIYGHGFSLHATELAVPLLVKLPGSSSAGIVDSPARSIDVLPTVLDAAGVMAPAAMQTPYRGSSLLGASDIPEDRSVPVFAELITDEYGPFFMQSAQTGTVKRVETFLHREQKFPEPRVDWFDRTRGELALRGAAAETSGGGSTLQTAMEQWRDGLVVEAASAARFSNVEEAELRDQLRALGYIE